MQPDSCKNLVDLSIGGDHVMFKEPRRQMFHSWAGHCHSRRRRCTYHRPDRSREYLCRRRRAGHRYRGRRASCHRRACRKFRRCHPRHK